MPTVYLTAVFSPDADGVVVNRAGVQARLVAGDLVNLVKTDDPGKDFLRSLTDDDLIAEDLVDGGGWPAFDSSEYYDVEVSPDGEVVVTITVDYDEDSPFDE